MVFNLDGRDQLPKIIRGVKFTLAVAELQNSMSRPF
jgi:hypothetical protein